MSAAVGGPPGSDERLQHGASIDGSTFTESLLQSAESLGRVLPAASSASEAHLGALAGRDLVTCVGSCARAAGAESLDDYLSHGKSGLLKHYHHLRGAGLESVGGHPPDNRRRRGRGDRVKGEPNVRLPSVADPRAECGYLRRGDTQLQVDVKMLCDVTRKYFNAPAHLHHPEEEQDLDQPTYRREFISQVDACIRPRRPAEGPAAHLQEQQREPPAETRRTSAAAFPFDVDAGKPSGGAAATAPESAAGSATPRYARSIGNFRANPPPWVKVEVRQPTEAEKTAEALENLYKNHAAMGERMAAANARLDKAAAEKLQRIRFRARATAAKAGDRDGEDRARRAATSADTADSDVSPSSSAASSVNSLALTQTGVDNRSLVGSTFPFRSRGGGLSSKSLAPSSRSAGSEATGSALTKEQKAASLVLATLKKSTFNRTKSDNQILFDSFRQLKAFEKLSDFILGEICAVVKYAQFDAYKTIFRQGDVGTCWYVIFHGRVSIRISKSGNLEEAVEVAQLVAGQGFGDLALVNDAPRAATVVALEKSDMLCVEKADYVRVLKFIHMKNMEEKAFVLKRIKIFECWRSASLKAVADKLTWVKYPAGATIVKEGQPTEQMWFVRTGTCDAYKELVLEQTQVKHEVTPKHSRRRFFSVGDKEPVHEPVLPTINAGTARNFVEKFHAKQQQQQRKAGLSTISELDATAEEGVTEVEVGKVYRLARKRGGGPAQKATQSVGAEESATGTVLNPHADGETTTSISVWMGEYVPYDYFGQECALSNEQPHPALVAELASADPPPSQPHSVENARQQQQQHSLSPVTVVARTPVELAMILGYDARAQFRSALVPSPYQNYTKKTLLERYYLLREQKKWNRFKYKFLLSTIRERKKDPNALFDCARNRGK